MGCIAKFIFTVLALLGFSALGWITIVPGASLLWAAFWAILIMALVDLVLILVNLLLQVVALPLSILTGGVLVFVIDGIFKYTGLYVTSYLTGLFVLPWILGALWWQALIIGFVFAVIGVVCAPRSSSSSSN